jgi:glycosyltransferase involved in cell wall biosynthesis
MSPTPSTTSLSVLVPVYNEQYLVAESLRRLEVLETSPHLERVEVIVVDDCSKDATAEVLKAVAARVNRPGSKLRFTFLRHAQNGGKGKAIQSALEAATCEHTVIHDADLEYNPKDLLRIVQVFVEESADAVFGSRFAGGEVRRLLFYRHELGNRFLTFLCNVVTNLNLTDMETCYKAVRTDLLKSIPIVSSDFRLEPELTIKLAKRQARIFEVPISYTGRSYQEGKKINWRDGFKALGAIIRFAASDDIYRQDTYGSPILSRLGRAPKFNGWMAEVIRPFCGAHVLEIGSGVGNISLHLVPRQTFVATDVNPIYLRQLETLRRDRPYLQVQYCNLTDHSTFPTRAGGFDTVICLNVVEHVGDDQAALENMRAVLSPEGRAIVLVPQGMWNFGTVDAALGHKRRYSRASLQEVAERAGFEVERLLPFNAAGSPAWWVTGRLLRRDTVGLQQIRMLNLLTPLLRRIDGVLPLPALSLIAVLRPRRDARPARTSAPPAAAMAAADTAAPGS